MKPVQFPGSNVTFAKDQTDYEPLPAHINPNTGVVTICWEIALEDVEKVVSEGKIYLQVITFNQPLQPLSMSVENPISQNSDHTPQN